MIVITLLVLLINTFYFFTEKKVKEIIQEKPLLFNSKKFSVIFAWSFFAIGIIIMFFLSSVVYKILN